MCHCDLKRFQRRGQLRVARILPVTDGRGERWTHAYQKADNYTRVDHILISDPLFAAVKNQVGRIEDGPGVLEASDHRPVVVELEFADK